ncbi:MAG TPA: hypothetical protein VD908_00670 [Cytophagales bacterium]|nr:hypothetical protein [Cytophagales bacterium]
MKKPAINYFFMLLAIGSIGFLSGCNNEDETPAPAQAEFNADLSNTGVILSSQYASAGEGSFYASQTKTVGTSSSSEAENVDVTYADIATSGTASDEPMFVSPDYRSSVNQEGTNGPVTDLNDAGTTYFKATSLDLSDASAAEVAAEIDSIGTEKSIEITGVDTNYLFSNSQTNSQGIIKVTELIQVETSTEGEFTSSIKFDIKVLK